MIQVNQISKRYEQKSVLENVTFHVDKGEILGLLGPNGAGKSTLLSIMATIILPTSGDILIAGSSVVHQPQEVRKKIGYVPQEIALYNNLSVLDNLFFWSSMAATEPSTDKINQILEVVGLTQRKKDKVSNLSGGLQRRVNIAVALLHDPQILIMDEPTVGVDIESKQLFTRFIKQLSEEGRTVVYTSHDQQEIQYLCDRVVQLA